MRDLEQGQKRNSSLMGEHLDPPFSRFIIQLIEQQDIHKVLFVTKSANVKNILELPLAKQVIFSFSLNSLPAAERWEKRAPSLWKRIDAAKKIFNKGYPVRIIIDPIVPIKNWKQYYIELIDMILKNFIPERITLGSLRGLQSTINGTKDRSWTIYLKEYSNWGKKIDFTTRYDIYSFLIKHLKNKHGYENIALCKESIMVWEKLGMNWKNIRCNCLL